MGRSPRFSAEIREGFPALAELFHECEDAADEYEVRFLERFTLSNHIGGRVSVRDAALLNMHSAHARARALTWEIIIAINEKLSASLFLVTRAHLETTGMMAYLLWRARQFRAGRISEDALADSLQRLFLGHRVPMSDDPTSVIPANEEAIQVLSLIDSVDHAFRGAARAELSGKFREAYEWLSEFCHPNLQSRLGDYDIDGQDIVFYRTPQLDESDIRMTLSHARLSQFMFFVCFTDCAELLENWPTTGGSS